MHGMKTRHTSHKGGRGRFARADHGHGGGRGGGWGSGEGRGHGLFGGRGGHGQDLGQGLGQGLGEGRGHGEGRGGPESHGGRRGKRFAGEDLRLMVLCLIEGEPHHGYQLIRSFAARSADAYTPSPGILYPMLTLLADMGLVQEVAAEGSGSRRSYGLTEAGLAELDANRERLEALFTRLAGLGDSASRTDAGPVRRAMMNLRTATVQRLGREGASDDLAFEVAAILDEAAQKIERLK